MLVAMPKANEQFGMQSKTNSLPHVTEVMESSTMNTDNDKDKDDEMESLFILFQKGYDDLKIHFDDYFHRYRLGCAHLSPFIKRIRALLDFCNSNPANIEKLLLRHGGDLIEKLVLVTNIEHYSAPCDIICLEFFNLIATTEMGADVLDTQYRQTLDEWSSYHNNHFTAKVRPILKTLRTTLAKRDGIPLKEDSYDIYNSIGILLGSSDLVERRIRLMPRFYKDTPREQFCRVFQKSCPGCIGLNIICAAQVLDDTPLVCGVVQEMLNDPRVLTVPELDELRRMSIFNYRRHDKQYPFMGDCVDFNIDSSFVAQAKRLGMMISKY